MERDNNYEKIVGISLSTFFLGVAGGMTAGMILMGNIIASKIPDVESNKTNCSEISQMMQNDDRIKKPVPN